MRISRSYLLLLAVPIFLAGCKPVTVTSTSSDSVSIVEKELPSGDVGSARRYSIKSARVSYELSGMETGTEVLVFDEYGAREARTRNGKIQAAPGMEVANNTLMILDGDVMYNIRLDTKDGTKINISDTKAADMMDKDLVAMGKEMIKAMGGVEIGTETILGKEATIWSIEKMGVEVSVWEGIPLRLSVTMMGMTMNSVATELEVGPSIAANAFAVPSGVTIDESAQQNLQDAMERIKAL